MESEDFGEAAKPVNPTRKPEGPEPRGFLSKFLWVFLVLGFGGIFYFWRPNAEIRVSYRPWFTDQLKNGNVKSITIEGRELHGKLFDSREYRATPNFAPVSVKAFHLSLSEEVIRPVIEEVVGRDGTTPNDRSETP